MRQPLALTWAHGGGMHDVVDRDGDFERGVHGDESRTEFRAIKAAHCMAKSILRIRGLQIDDVETLIPEDRFRLSD